MSVIPFCNLTDCEPTRQNCGRYQDSVGRVTQGLGRALISSDPNGVMSSEFWKPNLREMNNVVGNGGNIGSIIRWVEIVWQFWQ